jgi:hypothetical protein
MEFIKNLTKKKALALVILFNILPLFSAGLGLSSKAFSMTEAFLMIHFFQVASVILVSTLIWCIDVLAGNR